MILLQKRCRIVSLLLLLASLFSLTRAFRVADGFVEAGEVEVRGSSRIAYAAPARKPVAGVKLTEAVRRALDRAIAEIEQKSNAEVIFRVQASEVEVHQSPALAEMFPHDVFIEVPFRIDEGPASKDLVPWPFHSTAFAFDKDTGDVAEISNDRYEGFAHLLAKRKVALKTLKDVERIWDSFCALVADRHRAGACAGRRAHVAAELAPTVGGPRRYFQGLFLRNHHRAQRHRDRRETAKCPSQ